MFLRFTLVAVLFVISSVPCSDSTVTGRYLTATTEGYFAGTKPVNELFSVGNTANHHGVFYGDLSFIGGLNPRNNAEIGMRLHTPEFSTTQRSDIEPYARVNLGWGDSNGHFRWSFSAGETERVTVGHGLTFKNFRNLGTTGEIIIGRYKGALSFWGQGYTLDEDIVCPGLSAGFGKLEIGSNAAYWRIHKTTVGYLLPYFTIDLKPVKLYGEYGFKRVWAESGDTYSSGKGDGTHGFALGLSVRDTLRRVPFHINPEVRYYQKHFIPTTGVDQKYFENLENAILPHNDWIDFFGSNDRSFWYYHRIEIESPSLKNFTIFGANELLWFNSPQDTIMVDRYYSNVFSYKPSSNYYWAGVRYHAKDFASVDMSITNHMLNVDPKLHNPCSNGQYMRRFYPARNALFQLRIRWKLD